MIVTIHGEPDMSSRSGITWTATLPDGSLLTSNDLVDLKLQLKARDPHAKWEML